MAWKKVLITRDNGDSAEAMAPEIISASRSTDIPAFYCDWFFSRLEKGYCAWTNPFNKKRMFVSFQNTKFIVFWSKNPKPLLKYLPRLKERRIGCCLHFTLNDYVTEGLEKGVPKLSTRIDTFKRISNELGRQGVIWRFDPLILTDHISIDSLIEKIGRIGDELKDHTEKLIFSFADIEEYRKVKANLIANKIAYRVWSPELMQEFGCKLQKLKQSKGWSIEIAACAEKADLRQYGIASSHCIDAELIARLKSDDQELLDFLGAKKLEKLPQLELFSEPSQMQDPLFKERFIFLKKLKDPGQRAECGCIVSKDIGQYDTCPHQCEYCYANTSKETALQNYKPHCKAPFSETIAGD